MATVRKRSWTTKAGTSTAWLVDYRDGHGKRRFMSFDTKKEAQAALADATVEVKRGVHTPAAASITVAQAAQLWIERGEREGLERGSLRNYRHYADRFIVPALGGTKLAKLSTPLIEAFRDKLIEENSRDLARKGLAALKGILAEAQRRGLVAHNAAQPVRIDLKKRDQRRLEVGRDIPAKDEVRRMLAAADGRWRPLLVAAVFTGMRVSELRGLTWDDIDFDDKVVHVRQRADFWGTLGAPKSHAGQRTIPLSPTVINTLREWKLASPKSELGLVFPSRRGTVESLTNIRARGLVPLQRKLDLVDAEVNAKYGMHSLRHFAASRFIEQGFAPKKIQTWLGHSSVTMTFDTYGHLFPSLEDDHTKLAAGELELVGAGK